ncbi:hypothetical protein B0I35DRAFT_473314 [Stachybotrys elegans]|uniref:SCP domain-containing protein n=1 Tax=Stachybotrys elegans TaxID=80388 RepID=A0A8K0T3D6_9HYPO|nr:hypothetical protein B0I35DRAFT_473314 [Stachybotrys elegans]
MASGQQPFAHASGDFRPSQGEVLYEQESGQCDTAYSTPLELGMKDWLSQAILYDGKPITTGREPWLHYCEWLRPTTCLLSRSTEIGCARAFDISTPWKIFVVCRFLPEGNVLGQTPF